MLPAVIVAGDALPLQLVFTGKSLPYRQVVQKGQVVPSTTRTTFRVACALLCDGYFAHMSIDVIELLQANGIV